MNTALGQVLPDTIEEVAKKTRGKIGRPTKMTPETLAKLEDAWLNGANDLQATFIAGIGEQTLRDFIDRNPAYQSRKDAIKGSIADNAKRTIARAVKKDPHLALDVIERLEKSQWALRQEITGADGKDFTFSFKEPDEVKD